MLSANKELIRAYVSEVIHTGNVEIIDRFIAPDYDEVYECKKYAMGIEGAREHAIGVHAHSILPSPS